MNNYLIMQCPDNSDPPVNYYTVQICDEGNVLCSEQEIGANECRSRQYMTLRSCPSRVLTMKMNATNDAGESPPVVAGKNVALALLYDMTTVHPRLSEPLWSGGCAEVFG